MRINGHPVSLTEHYADAANTKTPRTAAQGAETAGVGSFASALSAALKAPARTTPKADGADLLAQLGNSAKLAAAFGSEDDKEREKIMLTGLAATLLQPGSAMSTGAVSFMTGLVKGAYGA